MSIHSSEVPIIRNYGQVATLKSVRKLALIAIAGILAFALCDWGLGSVMSNDHPNIEQTKGKHNGTAIVVYGGMQASTKALIAPHLDLLRRYGDVVTVEYSKTGFDGEVITADTHKKLEEWGYKKAVLLGVSMGGPLSTDLIDYDRENGHKLQFSVITADALTDVNDVNSQLGLEFMSYWHAGWLSDMALTDAFWWMSFDPPARDSLGQGVNQKQLEAHYDVSKTFPLSCWTGELRYVRDHPGYRPDTYQTIPLVVLQSEHDDVVKKEAARKWQLAFGGGTVITVPGSKHAGLVEWPREWDSHIEQALDKVA